MKKSIEELVTNGNSNDLTEAGKAKIRDDLLDKLSDSSTDYYFQIVSAYMKARRAKGLTTVQVAKDSGVPEITVHRFENLQNIPSAMTLLKILKAVNLKLIAQEL